MKIISKRSEGWDIELIRRIKDRLAAKVFILTAVLLAVCCGITYLCIAHFSPYIYTHQFSEAEEFAYSLSLELPAISLDDAPYFMKDFSDMLAEYTNDEYVFHAFKSSGEELALPDLRTSIDKRVEDYESQEKSSQYEFAFLDGTESYIFFATQNTDKESQVIGAIQKSFPVLALIVFVVSVAAAFFYTWYMTKPIKEVSAISKQMANMDFGSLCPVNRTDEIGILSGSLNELSQRLSTTLSELHEANQKLQADIDMERQLERQRIEFFSAASHELKTPITVIKGQLQGMLCEIGRYKDRETYLAQSLEVTNKLEEMVQELLTISRLDTPEYVCNKARFDFAVLVNESLKAHEDLFMRKELTVEKVILPEEVYLQGDVQLLKKVIDNLLSNAIAYSPAGNQVLLKLWQVDEKAILTLENTGVHIPDEDIPKLFEAFYRVEQSRNRQTGGSGLGLYIVKTILDLHDAQIRIENSKRGVIITIHFK